MNPAVIDLRAHVRDIPDFPKPGVLFRDIAPLLREHLPATVAALQTLYTPAEWANIDAIGGIEARGFILGAALALSAGKGFVPIRKAGKLPGPLVQRRYGLEYGKDTLELQHGSGRVLIVDDVLATGGTLGAAAELATDAGYTVAGFACLINLRFLNQFCWREHTPRTVLDYE